MTPQNSNVHNIVIYPDWKAYVDTIETYFNHEAENCFMICGGVSTGKSTFMKYFLNRMLSFKNVGIVGCIDLDPGQPEFSLPGNLSLSTFSSPIPETPASSIEEVKFSYHTEILLDSLSPLLSLIKYYKMTAVLREVSRKFNVPIIVNTMGHTQNAGQSIISTLIKLIEPSHVVTLKSVNSLLNFKISLTAEIINSQPNGYGDCEGVVVDFDGIELSAFNSICIPARVRKNTRDLKFLSYLNTFSNSSDKTCLIKNNQVELNFDCAIHIAREDIIVSYHLLAIYMQFVALCKVEDNFFIQHNKNRPKSLTHDSSWAPSSNFLGYGFINGVDPRLQKIYVITPISQESSRLVNTIIVTNIKIPMKFKQQFFCKGPPIEKVKSCISPRISYFPWFTWNEFELVKKWTFSGNEIDMHKAMQYILIWQSRSHIQEDIGLGSTIYILVGLLGLKGSKLERKWHLIQQCASKFVTLTHINMNKRWKNFIELADQVYPSSLTELRKNITHSDASVAPGCCEEGLTLELEVIKGYYWDREKKDIESYYSNESNGTIEQQSKLEKDVGLITPKFLETLLLRDNSDIKRSVSLKRKRKTGQNIRRVSISKI